ncbi:nucleotidyltransferase-like protein [Cytobacillus purgationiresistens]|uniref:Nucleotidyltransferase-like protein n=1 Tax=Cytobacillus purgationiresistens TaxID=863449 RepID=A0ABU0AS29_9BACI|nr:nucleotidyltransferase-like protein [Cytobacillus purgationiresistens]MDQ0273591.1 hypothetical protein [Cytobacillus purgationiresistens]
MEDILRPIYQERASQANTQGVLIIGKSERALPATDTFDAVLLIIVEEANEPIFVKHYTYENKKAALHVVTKEQIDEWLLMGSNKKIFEWLYNGKILFDRNEYIQNLKIELQEFPSQERSIKMGLEFAKLIRRYSDGKTLFENQNYFDAYNHVVHSLHHLARLTIIENGFHPEVTVWNQVRQMEPEIMKLYEELVQSNEPLEKRLELLFLASEFLIHSRTKVGITHLLDVLSEKEKWTIQEIIQHDELRFYSVDLSILLEYLIDKYFIEIMNIETKGKGIEHRYYKVIKKL